MSDRKLVCFAHGKESGPWGTKIRHLAYIAESHGWAVESPDFSATQDPDERVNQLVNLAPTGRPLVLCGSSMGGYVTAMACRTLQPAGLFLMAPALYLPGYAGEPATGDAHAIVVHGWHDELVPPDSAIRFARERSADLHLLDDGHRLATSLAFIGERFGALLDRVVR